MIELCFEILEIDMTSLVASREKLIAAVIVFHSIPRIHTYAQCKNVLETHTLWLLNRRIRVCFVLFSLRVTHKLEQLHVVAALHLH